MSEFEQIMMAFKKQKLSFTDNAIFDGIVERYNQRNSLTPKQALWFLKKLIKSQIEVPVEYADYIEKPSLLEQKHAQKPPYLIISWKGWGCRGEATYQVAHDVCVGFPGVWDWQGKCNR